MFEETLQQVGPLLKHFVASVGQPYPDPATVRPSKKGSNRINRQQFIWFDPYCCVDTIPQEVDFPKSSRTIKSELAYYVPNKVCDFDLTLGQMSWVENKRATKRKRKSRV